MATCADCGRQTQRGRKCKQCCLDDYWEDVAAGDIPHPLEEGEQ